MAFPVTQPFKRTTKSLRFEDDVLTKSQMLQATDDQYETGYLVIDKDTLEFYVYNQNATPSPTTGKFVKKENGGGVLKAIRGVTTTTEIINAVNEGKNILVYWTQADDSPRLVTKVDVDSPYLVYLSCTFTTTDGDTYAGLFTVHTDVETTWTYESKKLASFPSGGTTGQVLAKKSNADGDVEWADGGSGGGVGMTKTVLWESETDVGNVEQELSKSVSDYDLLYVQCRYNRLSTNNVRTTVVIDVKQIKYGQTQMYSTGPSTGAFVYFRFNDDTHIQQVTQTEYYVEKVIGIRFGSSLDGTIGRWEKLGSVAENTRQDITIPNLTEYNTLALSSSTSSTDWNTCIITLADFPVGKVIQSSVNNSVASTLTRKSDTTVELNGYPSSGAVLYGYKETAISDADVQKIADATALKSTNMEALWNNGELKGMKLFQNDKDLRLFDDGQILIIDDTTTKSVNLAKKDYVDSKSPTIVNEGATFTNALGNQKMQIRTSGANGVTIKDTNGDGTTEYWSHEVPNKNYVDTELAKKGNTITIFDNEYKTFQTRDVNDSVEFQVVKETSNDYIRMNEYAEDDRGQMQPIFDVKLPTKEYVDSKGGGVNMEVGAEKWYGTYTENNVTYQTYTKIVYIPALPSTAGITTYPMGVSNIKQILDIYGYTTDGFILNAPRQNAQDNISIYQVSKGSQTFSIEVGKDRSSKSAYVTIIYAKNN